MRSPRSLRMPINATPLAVPNLPANFLETLFDLSLTVTGQQILIWLSIVGQSNKLLGETVTKIDDERSDAGISH